MENLVRKCIHDHRHPIVKVTLPLYKLFFTAKNDEEKALIKEHQNQFMAILEHQRVEKRSSRAQAIWRPDESVAQVTKVVKNLVKYFGYQNKDGLFLYPEEMLYLLETNRLEVIYLDTTLSIERAYELVLKTTNVNLNKYRVYKKLAVLGYKLIRFEQIGHKTLNRIRRLKRTLEQQGPCDLPAVKKIKTHIPEESQNHSESNESCNISLNDSQAKVSIWNEAQRVLNIFDDIKAGMPRDCVGETNSTNPDYCVLSPTNVLRVEPDFNLFICENNIGDKKNFNSNIPNIYAIYMDDVTFYRFSDIHLPNI